MKDKLSFLLVLFLLLFFVKIAAAHADDLIIHDDGQIVLVVTSSGGVMGVTTSTTTPTPSKSDNPPKKEESKNEPPKIETKTVPLVPAHTQSSVKITPPAGGDKKIQVTITSPPSVKLPTSVPAPGGQLGNSQAPSGATAETNLANVVTKTVDQVVAEGTNGQPVLTIKSDRARELTIQQGTTAVTTQLPLQIDAPTRTLSVPSASLQTTRISVLPTEAVQGVLNTQIVNDQALKSATFSLINDNGSLNYDMESFRRGMLFGLIPVSSPVQVELSAQSGQVVKTSQSPLFDLLGGFIQ